MIDRIKYVIIDGCKPILFNAFNHSDMTAHGKPTSAGFVSLEEVENTDFKAICASRIIRARCYGESTSLKMKPGPHDEWLITRMLNPC
jgi:hypothetical protein